MVVLNGKLTVPGGEGVLLIWVRVGQRPSAFAVGVVWTFFLSSIT